MSPFLGFQCNARSVIAVGNVRRVETNWDFVCHRQSSVSVSHTIQLISASPLTKKQKWDLRVHFSVLNIELLRRPIDAIQWISSEIFRGWGTNRHLEMTETYAMNVGSRKLVGFHRNKIGCGHRPHVAKKQYEINNSDKYHHLVNHYILI